MNYELICRIGAAQRLAEELANATKSALAAFSAFDQKELDAEVAARTVRGCISVLVTRVHYSGADYNLKIAVNNAIDDLVKLEASINEIASWRAKWAAEAKEAAAAA